MGDTEEQKMCVLATGVCTVLVVETLAEDGSIFLGIRNRR